MVDQSLAADRTTTRVVIAGGGPVGLTLAISMAEQARILGIPPERFPVTVYDLRWHGAEGQELEWSSMAEGAVRNRRREQVVTLQDSAVSHFDALSAGLRGAFRGARVWPRSQNVPIREVEDRLLRHAQTAGVAEYVALKKVPREVSHARRAGGPKDSEEVSAWISGLDCDVLVGADGSSSSVLRCYLRPQPRSASSALGAVVGAAAAAMAGAAAPAAPRHGPLIPTEFGREKLTRQEHGEGLVEDHAIGVGFEFDESWTPQPEALSVCITLAQNRYLLNMDEEGRRGFLNIRLTKEESEKLRAAAKAPCKFSAPCQLWDVFKTPQQGAIPICDADPQLQSTIDEGLELFGIPKKLRTTVIAWTIDPEYATDFHIAKDGKDVLLVGDAAMSHHFWPGRGLNSGLLGAAALARAVISAHRERSPDPYGHYSAFMQALRQREMQGRSQSMLADHGAPHLSHSCNLEAVAKDVKQASLPANVRDLTEKLIFRVKKWRDHMEAQKTWPHPHLSDEDIEAKFTGATRPSPYVMWLLDGSAKKNKRDLWGWPVDEQTAAQDALPGAFLRDVLEAGEGADAPTRGALERAAAQRRESERARSEDIEGRRGLAARRQQQRAALRQVQQRQRQLRAEGSMAEEQDRDPLAYYEFVLKINCFSDLWTGKGWPLSIRPDSAASTSTEGVNVAVLGNFKRGKTWFLGKVTGANFPSSDVIHTPGLCSRSVCVNKKWLHMLDMKGDNTPLDRMETGALSEKKAEESFMRELVCEVSDAFIYMVQGVGWSEQLTLYQFSEELKKRAKSLPTMIVVHNLRQLHTAEHLQEAEAEIVGLYATQGLRPVPEDITIDRESGQGASTMQIRYLESCRTSGSASDRFDGASYQTRHFILGAEDTAAGAANDFVIEKIRRMLLDVPPTRRAKAFRNLVEEVAGLRMAHYVNGQPTVRYETVDGQQALVAVKSGEADLSLRRLDLGTFVSVRADSVGAGKTIPDYCLSETDSRVLLRVDLPGMDKARLKSAVKIKKELDGVTVTIAADGRQYYDPAEERENDRKVSHDGFDCKIKINAQVLKSTLPVERSCDLGVLKLAWEKEDTADMSVDLDL